MKKIFVISLILNTLISCNTTNNRKADAVYYDEFYSILNDLLRFNLTDISVIKCETMKVYKTTLGSDSSYLPDPPAEFTSGALGIIKCDSNIFIPLIRRNLLNSEEAWFMYNSIDPSKAFNLDSSRVFLPTIDKTQFGKLFDSDDYYEGYEQLKTKYGTSCYITVSTPIFNADYSKILLFINYYCGPTWGQGYQFVLKKKDGHWRLIDESGTWES